MAGDELSLLWCIIAVELITVAAGLRHRVSVESLVERSAAFWESKIRGEGATSGAEVV